MARQLLICLEGATQRNDLLAFLRGHGCEAAAVGEADVAVDDCDSRPPGVATLVALVEEWRAGAHVPEAILELDGRRTILRTEA